jgi:YVTN family beta-propeller protein
VLATLVVGIEPKGVAASPDGRWIYVTAETSNTVSVIDAAPTGWWPTSSPTCARAPPPSRRTAPAYVTNEVSGTLVVVDTRTHQVLRSVELERGEGKPVGVVASPDGARVYMANGMASSISVLDARTLRQVAHIPVARRPWGSPSPPTAAASTPPAASPTRST